MGLLSSSRSDSTVNYTTNSTTTNQDNRMAAGDNSLVLSLDGGAAYSDSSQVAGAGSQQVRLDGGSTYTATQTTNNYSSDAGVLAAAGDAIKGVLPFLTSQTAAQTSALNGYRESLEQSYAKFSSDTLSLFNGGNARAAAAEQAAYAFSRSSLDNSLNFSRETLTKSSNQSDTALAAIRQTSDTLLNFITQREKDPNERAFSQTVPWLIGGAVIIGIFAFGSRGK